MKTLAVVCARKGSARLAGKHWKKINETPMFKLVLEAAHKSIAAATIVSTDDERMLKWVKARGWLTSVRDPEFCTDTASIHHALIQVVRSVEARGFRFDAVACLPANVPTTTAKLINKCIRTYQSDHLATSAITVKPACCLPEWMWTKARFLQRCHPEIKKYRVQDFPERYIATGSCAVVGRDILMACKSDEAFAWLGKHIIPVEDVHAIEVHDLDDLKRARAWLRKK